MSARGYFRCPICAAVLLSPAAAALAHATVPSSFASIAYDFVYTTGPTSPLQCTDVNTDYGKQKRLIDTYTAPSNEPVLPTLCLPLLAVQVLVLLGTYTRIYITDTESNEL
jgi:hypothetical protein